MPGIKEFFILKNAITAKSITHVFKEGSSLPVIAEDPAGHKYFTKLKGTGEGVRALIAEYLSLKLAAILGIPVLEPVFIYVNVNTSVKIKNDELNDLVRKSYGINLGFRFLGNTRVYNEKYDGKFMEDELKHLIFLYDCFLLNVDRTKKNSNIILQGKNIFILDFGASFLIKGFFDNKGYERSSEILKQLKRNIFYDENVKAVLLRKQFSHIKPDILHKILNELPEEWISYNERNKLESLIYDKLRDRNYLSNILENLSSYLLDSEESMRKKQIENRDEFKKKFKIL